jgi:outer membrane protein
MKKIRAIIICWMIFIVPCSAFAAEYSLGDLYRLALEKSETIKIAEEDLSISERDKDRALSALLPTFSAFGYHTHYTKDIMQGGALIQPDYTNEWGLRIGRTFSLSGREFTVYSTAKEGIEKSRFDLSAIQEGYLFTVATQYYTVLRARRETEIAHANVKRLTKQRDAARKRLEVGEVTKTVLLRAEAELAGAQSELIKADNALIIAKTRLAKTAGITGEYAVTEPLLGREGLIGESGEIDLSFLRGDCALPIPDCLKQQALSERAEIRSLTIERDVAEEGVKIARGSYWPDITLEGVYSRQENDPASSFGIKERTYGAVKLDFPFFEGGLTKAEVGQARARLRQAEYSLLDQKRTIGVEVENAYLVAVSQGSVLKQLKAELGYAADNYNLVSKQFQYGLADSLDVIDANTLLVTTEREFRNSEYEYQLALLRLKRATGTLLKEVRGD